MSRLSTCGLFLFAICVVHGTAARVNIKATEGRNAEKREQAREQAQALTSREQAQAVASEPERGQVLHLPQSTGYWFTHWGSWNLLGLVDHEHIQQFEVKEDYRKLKTKKYKAKLEEWEDPNTFMEVRRHIGARVMELSNHFFTMHATQTAKFTNEHGMSVGEYLVFNPQVINRYYTWRVARADDANGTVLFTIQKRLWNDHCKHVGWFGCKPVLKIYVGHKGDKSTLIYYGVGDKDLEEPDFKFYHSEEQYLRDKKSKNKWVAKVDHKKTKKNDEDQYKVKVKPGEDAALILLAATCLDVIGDAHKKD